MLSDDNLVPLLYQKELTNHELNASGHTTSHANDHHNATANNLLQGSDVINDTPLPYNSWKSRFSLKKSDSPKVRMDMQSKLGQSLNLQEKSLQSETLPLDNKFPYSQSKVGIDCRQMDPTFNDQANFKSQERYISDGQVFNCSYNETPKGYFPDYNKKQPFQGNFNSTENCFRNLNHSFTGRLEYHTPERMYSHSSHIPFGKPSHSFSPQHISSSPYNVPSFNGSADFSPGCQNVCCSNNMEPHRIHQGIHNGHSSIRNSEFHPNYQSKQLKKLSPEPHSCNCQTKSEARNKKWEKIDKVRKKQISDLYRIVWLQNEQIIQIQNELKKIIQINNEKNDEKSKRSYDNPEHSQKISHKGTSEKRMFNLSVIEENKNLMEKVSVGIMTSFIDTTVKKKGNSKNKNQHSKKSSSSSSSPENSSHSSSEGESSFDNHRRRSEKHSRKKVGKPYDDSLALSCLEVPPITPDTPSPNSSPVHIELQDFDSSSKSEDSDSSGSEENGLPPVGWTFYDKVVGKVNNMLNKSESGCDSEEEVQRKTLEQLRKLGISMDQESPSSKRVTFNAPFQKAQLLPESDTSMKMNALAVKYFKEDRSSPEESKEQHQSNIANNTNLSYATLRYLERYHLPKLAAESSERIEKKSKKKKEKTRIEENYDHKKSYKKKSKLGHSPGKILDITAIKQQPKLLPKKQ